MPVYDPPLLGDRHGNYRIQVVGNTGMSIQHEFSMFWVGLEGHFLGTGKSTLGAYLSTKLNIPHIPLDAIVWQPGWQKMPSDEFKEKISILMAQNTRGWIIDGNCQSSLGALVHDNATDMVWSDPPLRHYLPRLLWRTLMRILGLREQCAEGCRETWKEIFSSEGIIRYCVTNHSIKRDRSNALFTRMSVEVGGRMVRLDESRGELTRWKDSLEEYLRHL